jgi:hypothetical protein
MNDLLKSQECRRLETFGELFITAIKDGVPSIKNNKPLIAPDVIFAAEKITSVETKDKKVLILVDDAEVNPNLSNMVERLRQTFSPAAEMVQLKDIDIKGGCLGCVQCGFDNVCVFEGKDGYIDFFNQKIKTADILFFAGAIHDRYLSSLWKCYFDRSFFNGHTPVIEGKQIGFAISGPFGQIYNLREIFEASIGIQHAGLVGFVSDDMGSPAEINIGLQNMASRSVAQSKLDYIPPPTFYQIAGSKIFRDAVWGRLRVVFQADHKYYQEHGMYDFPQRNYKWRIINSTLVLLTKIPAIRREFIKRMKTEMIKPCANVVKKTEPRV